MNQNTSQLCHLCCLLLTFPQFLPAHVCLPAAPHGAQRRAVMYACSSVFPTNTQPHPAASIECSTLTTERVCVCLCPTALLRTLRLFRIFPASDESSATHTKHCIQPQRARSCPFSSPWPLSNTPGATFPPTRHPHSTSSNGREGQSCEQADDAGALDKRRASNWPVELQLINRLQLPSCPICCSPPPAAAAASAAFGSDCGRTLVRLLLPRDEANFGAEKCALLTLTMLVRRRGAHVGRLGWLGGRD